jgi:hypothetical protein
MRPLQDHIDYLSVHALVFRHAAGTLSPFQQARLLFSFRTRISD